MQKQAVIRLVVFLILLLNQGLIVFGWNPLPFSEEEIYAGVSNLAVVAQGVWTWWKNAPMTKEAKIAHKEMERLKRLKDVKK